MGENDRIVLDDGLGGGHMNVLATARYEALPFTPTPERAHVVSAIMRGVCEFETVFTDYNKPCPSVCQACDACTRARATVALMMSKPDARAWEIWRFEDTAELIGIMYVDKVVAGSDARAHYVFFDRKLTDKTALLRDMIDWLFTDHDDWRALKRLTVEVPDYAFATARHAYKKLGFGGDFVYRQDGKSIHVEGVRRGAFRWRGVDRDMLVLGRLNVA